VLAFSSWVLLVGRPTFAAPRVWGSAARLSDATTLQQLEGLRARLSLRPSLPIGDGAGEEPKRAAFGGKPLHQTVGTTLLLAPSELPDLHRNSRGVASAALFLERAHL